MNYDPKYRPQRLPARVNHERIGTGGQFTVTGPEAAVNLELDYLRQRYPYEPYQGHEAGRTKVGNEVTAVFRYWSAE